MLKYEEALLEILNSVEVLPAFKMPILKTSGLVISENIYSSEDIPHFDNSAMDGYAVRADDTYNASKTNPVILNVVDGISARRTTVKIRTGLKIPAGAEAVVMLEDTEVVDSQTIKVFRKVEKGENIRFLGESVKAGELIIKSGKVLTPPDIGILASLGISKVSVIKRPEVAILATGDEIIDINKVLKEGKVRNSNSYSLYSLVELCGAIPVLLGIAKDTENDLKEKIKLALKYDCLITSGGVSVGEYDFVKDVITKLKGSLDIWRVAIKPGKPLVFGKIKQKAIFGLPGNPVSAMVTFDQFVKPALYKMMGKTYKKRIVKANFKNDYRKKTGRREFVRVKVNPAPSGGAWVSKGKDGWTAEITGPQGSGILISMVLADGYLMLPEETSFVRGGSLVDVELFDYVNILLKS
ncbi:MAG: gephyrin-like molybdotransferase Glp [Candidatus Firestonebacteria bacterium]